MSAVFDPATFGSVFVTLLVVMDPPGGIPIFLSLTRRLSRDQQRAAARRAALVALAVIAVFAVFGQRVLDYLHISIPAMQGSGGLLLLLVALELLTGKETEAHEQQGVNVALVPLGTPLLAGPGAIVTTMLAVQRADGAAQIVAVALGLTATVFVVWLVLHFAVGIRRVLKEAGTVLASRIAGLLLAAIAVQMMADAVAAFVQAMA